MALTPFEEKLVSNYMDATYPQPEPEPVPEQASMDGVQLAAGPSPVVSDAGAAFGVYPGMGKRSQRSDIGERVITGAPDFAAGAARGATTAALGLGGDIQTLGRFIAALATDDQGGGIMDKLGRAAQTMSLPTLLPTSENLSKGGYTIPGTSITLPGLPSAVPAGQGGFGMTPEQRQSAAEAGQFVGELVGDPVMFAKAGQVAAKAVKATKGLPVGMSTEAVGGMDGVLTQSGASISKRTTANSPWIAREDFTAYINQPRQLQGFKKDGPNKGFGEQNYKHSEFVEVKFEDGTTHIDAIRGLNKTHALSRAFGNWPDASEIRPLARNEVQKLDPDLVKEVEAIMGAAKEQK